MPRGFCRRCGRGRGAIHTCPPPDPTIVLEARPLGPVALIGQYLLWHAVTVCDGRCLVCLDAAAFLAEKDALPTDLGRLVASAHSRASFNGEAADA
jgi:hypothetical protein